MNAKKKLGIKTGDTVVVITGKQAPKLVDGKPQYTTGKVTQAYPATGRIIVEGVNVVTRHQKPRGQGMPGGIIDQEAAIPACKVMLVCPSCKKATRVAHKFVVVEGQAPKKVRACKKCGATIDN